MFEISTSDEENEDQPRRSNKRGKDEDANSKKSEIPAKKMRVSDSHDPRLFEAELENISNLLVETSGLVNLKASFVSNFVCPVADYVPKCPSPPPYIIRCDNDGGDGYGSGGDSDSGRGAVDGDSSAPSVGSGGGYAATPFPSCAYPTGLLPNCASPQPTGTDPNYPTSRSGTHPLATPPAPTAALRRRRPWRAARAAGGSCRRRSRRACAPSPAASSRRDPAPPRAGVARPAPRRRRRARGRLDSWRLGGPGVIPQPPPPPPDPTPQSPQSASCRSIPIGLRRRR